MSTDTPPIHYLSGQAMAKCPECDRWSGLTGIDAGPCLACSGGASPERVERDHRVQAAEDGEATQPVVGEAG